MIQHPPALSTETAQILISPSADTNARYRLRIFSRWMDAQGLRWFQPDLAGYRDYLLTDYQGRDGTPLQPTSVRTHLATIRSRYKDLLRDPLMRDYLYGLADGQSPADQKAFVDEVVYRLQNAIDPQSALVKVVTSQDSPDSKHLRLTSDQALALLQAPGMDTLIGLRDTLILSLMLCTGIREAELCGLDVEDLRQQLSGALALHVRQGKGSKERLVPYGELSWVLAIADEWLWRTGIEVGAVLRGIYKGGKRIRPTRLSVRSINHILDKYPLMIDGEYIEVNPHDLRRTYARQLYEAGVELLAIRDNLGHSDSRTTLNYIGTMDVEARKPPMIYAFDLSALKG